MKKIFIFLTSAIFIFTGCSNEQKPKNKSVSISSDNKKQEDIEDKKDNDTEDKESQKKNKEVKTTQVKHDYAEAEKIAKEHILVGTRLDPISVFHYLNYDREKKEKYGIEIENVKEVKLSFIIDKYNTHLSDVYNEDFVLLDFINKIKDQKVYFAEVDNDFESEAVSVVNNMPSSNFGKQGTIYFKKDKVFVSLVGGIGGPAVYKLSDKSMWREDGENLIIPIQGIGNKYEEIVLAINNKEYTGGEHHSYYYVKSPLKS